MSLVDEKGDLHPAAAFRVVAVMIAPLDEHRREAYLAEWTAGPHLPRHEFRAQAARLALAGDVLLRLIDLDNAYRRAGTAAPADLGQRARHLKPSLNKAIAQSACHLADRAREEDQVAPIGAEIMPQFRGDRRRAEYLNIWRTYRPVAHLWAAFLNLIVKDPTQPDFIGKPDGAPDPRALAIFLRQAALLAFRGSRIFLDTPGRRGRRTCAIDRRSAWQFELPRSHAHEFSEVSR